MALREILANFLINVDDKQLKAADKSIGEFTKGLKKVGAALLGAATIGAVKSFVEEMTALEGSVTDTAAQLGIGTTALQQWRLAGKLAGAEAADVDKAFMILGKNAAGGAAVFNDLGIKIKDGTGQIKDTPTLMRETGLAIAGLSSPAERTKAAMEAFGKAGTKLIPMFNDGAEGVDRLLGQLEELGGGFGEEALDTVGKMGDELDRLEVATTSVKTRLAAQFFPVLSKGLEVFNKWLGQLARNKSAIQTLMVALGALGTAALIAGAQAAAPWLALAAAIGLAFLLVQDFIVFMRGGDSVIGRALDKTFGQGTSGKLRETLKKWGQDITKAFGEGIEQGLRAVLDKAGIVAEEFFSTVGADLVKFFADDLPEASEIGASRIRDTGGTFEDWAVVVSNALNPVAWAKSWKDFFKDMSTIGENAINDLISGMTGRLANSVPELKKAVADLVTGGIKEPMRGPGGLDAHSPSRFTQRLAGDTADGWIGGLVNNRARIARATAGATQAITTSIGGNRTASVSQSISNVFHVQGGGSVRHDVSQALKDEREAALAAVEAIA